MSLAKDITEMRFGRLVAIKPAGKANDRVLLWLCKCDCGNEHIVRGKELRNGDTKSCGCLNKEIVSQLKKNAEQLLNPIEFTLFFTYST